MTFGSRPAQMPGVWPVPGVTGGVSGARRCSSTGVVRFLAGNAQSSAIHPGPEWAWTLAYQADACESLAA